MSDKKRVYIALGANLSNPKRTFAKALAGLSDVADVVAVSGLWQSPSWPSGQGHPDYINAVAELETALNPLKLLAYIKRLEVKYGRIESERNAPRPLDLDILDYDSRVIDVETLVLPHPRMLTRTFVLFPLEQIAPNWRDPVSGEDISQYIAQLPLNDVDSIKFMGVL